MIMNEIVSKIKSFFMGNYKTMAIVGGIIIVCFLVWYMFSGRENVSSVSSNGNTIDAIRNELSNAQDAKSDIAGTTSDIANTSSDIAETVGNLANSINNVTDTSERFDQLINECQSIIDQIREQPAGE